MEWAFVGLGVGLVGVLAWLVWMAAAGRDAAGDGRLPYVLRESLLTRGERAFHGALCEAVGEGRVVMVQVRLADVVTVPAGTPEWRAYFNKTSQKSLDFVVCERETLRPVVAVELDDRSHGRASRRAADATKDAVLEAAGLPLVRVRARRGYDVGAVRGWLAEAGVG